MNHIHRTNNAITYIRSNEYSSITERPTLEKKQQKNRLLGGHFRLIGGLGRS